MSKQHKICVLAGLSGVGKSFLINRLTKDYSGYVHFSAGALIKKRRSSIDHDELRLLPDDEVLRNQYLLIDQFQQEISEIKESTTVLFDAHMIIDMDTSLFEIPFDIFARLSPDHFVYLSENPGIIAYRRIGDTSRKRPNRTIMELTQQQDRSLELAKNYADKLGIEFEQMQSANIEALERIMNKIGLAS